MQLPDPKLRIEAAFVDLLKTSDTIETKTIVSASDREVTVSAPYIMCWAQRVDPRSTEHFVVEMQIVLVTNIDDTTNALRMAEAGRIYEHIANSRVFETGDAKILGWSRPVPREASSNQETADSLVFTAGVQINTDNPEMSTQIRNIEIATGETLSFLLTNMRDGAGALVTDATGWAALLQFRTPAGAVALETVSTVEGAALRPRAPTSSVAAGVYDYDVRLVSPTAAVSYPYKGRVTVYTPSSRPA